jgi:hypothetical protein
VCVCVDRGSVDRSKALLQGRWARKQAWSSSPLVRWTIKTAIRRCCQQVMWAAHRSAQSLRIGIFRPAACEPGHRPPPLHRAARRAARFSFRTLGADANAPYTRSPRIDEGARSDHALQALAAVRCDEQITARQIRTSASTARRDPPCLLLPPHTLPGPWKQT